MIDPVQIAASQGIDAWEAAYLRFETPEEEIRKFTERLRRLGASKWPRETNVVELFCGRGNGLHALARLGFRNIKRVYLSPRFLAEYGGEARRYPDDCRECPCTDHIKDAATLPDRLHH